MTPQPVPPRLEALLLSLLVRGAGAEFVIGDVLEGWADDRRRGLEERDARRRLRRNVMRSVAHWWRLGAVLARTSLDPTADRRPAGGGSQQPAGDGPNRGESMTWLLHDLRTAARGLVRRPALALAVVLTLGLGIGSTTTIFSVVDGVLLRPLPFEDPGSLVAMGTTFPGREWREDRPDLMHLAGMSMANYLDLRDRARSFEAIAAFEMTSILLPDSGNGPEIASTASVSPEFFPLLGVTPALGRTFLPEEHEVGEEAVFVITHGAWQRRFGGDASIVGQSLDKVGMPATIVGILPANFAPPEAMFPRVPDFWAPIQPEHRRYADRGRRSLGLFARLLPGVGVEEARAEATVIAEQLATEFPDGNVYPDGKWFGIGVNDLHAETVGGAGRTLWIFLGASGLLLLLATLNAATLLLARALERRRELGVRMALGSGRGRVVRLLLAEASLVAVGGCLLGVAIAYAGVETFLRFAPSSIPRIGMVRVDGSVLWAAAVVSAGAGLIAGLLPALRLSRVAPWQRLGGGGRTAHGGSRLRLALVGGQLALAVPLLAGAALLLSSFFWLRSVEPGFDPDGLLSMNVALKRPEAPEGEEPWQAWESVLDEVRSVPGLDAVAGTTNPPFQSPFWAPRLLFPGEPPDTQRSGIAGYAITPGYFEAVGTRLLSGRELTSQDGPRSARVAIVNESFVLRELDGADPIGRVFRHVGDDGEEGEITIVGVVEDVIQTRAQEGPLPAVYFPYTQTEWPLVQVVVRTTRPLDVVVPELRKAVARFNPYVPATDLRTLDDRMAATRTTPRFQAMLFGFFAGVALALAAAGLYGALAHAVGTRQRELGVRMALGADRRRLLWMVLRQGLRTSALGLGLGIAVAVATTRLLASLLYGVEPTDPMSLLGVAGLLMVVAAAASLLPARRATTVDPVRVLRSE